jgi:hypothetical protein
VAEKEVVCEFSACTKPAAKRGLCESHYQQYRRNGELKPLKKWSRDPSYRPDSCNVEGCFSYSKAKGLCDKHYRRMRVTGSPTTPHRPPSHTSPVAYHACGYADCEVQLVYAPLCKVHKKKVQYARDKSEAISLYGGKCSCCGEIQREFLTLDHINNDGASQRKELGNGVTFLRYVLKERPKDLTVLCFNCNCAKGVYGTCPHLWEEGK